MHLAGSAHSGQEMSRLGSAGVGLLSGTIVVLPNFIGELEKGLSDNDLT